MLNVIPNEVIFIVHVALVAGFTLGSLRLGKEALTSVVCLNGLLANLFVTKQITLFGMSVVSTDVFMVGSMLGLNMLQEYFGKTVAQRAIVVNAVMLVMYLIMSYIHVWYLPNAYDVMHGPFSVILSHMPRIVISSVVVCLVVQFFDAHLYHMLKTFFGNRYLLARNITCLLLLQLGDTVLFSFAALYGTVYSVIPIIIVSYTIKLLVIACSSPFISLSKLVMKIK